MYNSLRNYYKLSIHLLNVLLYYYFRFYKNTVKLENPFLTAKLALSFSISLFINGVIGFISILFFCYVFEVWMNFGIAVLIVILININYGENWEELEKINPKIHNSAFLSKIVTIVFFVLTTLYLFVGPLIERELLKNC